MKQVLKQVLGVDVAQKELVVTLGKYGACGIVKGDAKCLSIPSFDIDKVVDTTGAGDAFLRQPVER